MSENKFLEHSHRGDSVRLTHVCKSFPMGDCRLPVLSDVNLVVPHGELISVMGASGSGKTTLLNITGALLSSDEGDVEIDGVSLTGLNDCELTAFRRNRIGFIFQMFNLIPSLTVEENVILPFLSGGGHSRVDVAREREACRYLLDKVGLSGRLQHKPRELSGGEQQRVAIARALCHRPGLVLADEPTGNLDSTNTRSIGKIFRELHEETRVTMMIVTHEPSVAMWADRVIILRDGAIATDVGTEQFASPSELSVFYQDIVESASV
ncbi:MAG: ABC transporter ATP-binding protein [Akkermansia sp.]